MRVQHVREKAITPVEAARRLGVTIQYLYTLLWTGRLQATREGKRWLVSAQAVEQRRLSSVANLIQKEAKDGKAKIG